MSREHALLQLERAVMDTQRLTEAQAADIEVRRRAGALVDAVVMELQVHPEYLEDLGLVPPAAMNKPFSGVERE